MDEALRLPVEADTAAFVANLTRALEAMEKLSRANDSLAKAAKEAGEAAGGMDTGWRRAERAFQGFLEKAGDFWDSSSRFGEAYRNIKEPLADVVEGVHDAAEGIARLAGEQARLDRASQGLGLSLQHAQEYAGGFADQTEIATAALTLQGQGIRLQQQELDALTRLAMRRAIDTGRDLHDVLENLTEAVTEGGEEFGKVAPELLYVADSSHTAGERLAAMVEVANRVGPAARDAATEFERYTSAVRTSQRDLAAGFVAEITHLDQITSKTRDARDAADDWHNSMQGVGHLLGLTLTAAGNGIGVIVGTLATGIATIPALMEGVQNAVSAFTDADNLRRGVAGTRASEAFRAALNNETLTALTDFTAARYDAIQAIADDQDTSRTSADPGRSFTLADAARNRLLRNSTNAALGGQAGQADMTFGLAEANSDMFFSTEQAQALQRTWDTEDRNRQQSGRDAARRRREREQRFQQLMSRAAGGEGLPFTGDFDPNAPLAVLDEDYGTEANWIAANAGKSAAQRAVNEAAFGQSDEGRLRDRRRETQAQRERREQDHRLDQRESFLERWERLNQREIVMNDVLAESMSMGFDVLSTSFSDHLRVLLEGNEAGAKFWETMAADTMAALGKEAFGKAAFYAAESLGFLVMGNVAGAGTAAAASVAYGAAGAALTYGAAEMGAFAPEPKKGATGGGGGSAPSRPRLAGDAGTGEGRNTTTIVNHYYSPVIGGREASDAEVGTRLGRFSGAADRRVQRDRS